VEEATRQVEQSIADAKSILEREQENINATLGGMDGAGYIGPRVPTLPGVVRSMEPREFTLAALKSSGARVTPQPADLYLTAENGGREYIRFEAHASPGTRSTLYAPGTTAFLRLVGRVVATGIHEVEDLDTNPIKESEEITRRRALSFDGTPRAVEIEEVHRYFEGIALVRVRAAAAHDSYEHLVEVSRAPTEHHARSGRSGLGPLPPTIEDPSLLLNMDSLAEAAKAEVAPMQAYRVKATMQEDGKLMVSNLPLMHHPHHCHTGDVHIVDVRWNGGHVSDQPSVSLFRSRRRCLSLFAGTAPHRLCGDPPLGAEAIQPQLWDSWFSELCDAGRYSGAEMDAQICQRLGVSLPRREVSRLWALAFEPNAGPWRSPQPSVITSRRDCSRTTRRSCETHSQHFCPTSSGISPPSSSRISMGPASRARPPMRRWCGAPWSLRRPPS
jgi:hypothetical protein